MKKTFKVTNRQQLIDLNGDTVNFDLTFTATAKNGESFEVLVVDQSTLDNNPNLEFKQVNGTISGNIVSDKNVYQNYFLCLRAPQPCDVEIDIAKREIPPQQPPQQPLQQHQINHPIAVPPKNDSTNWKAIIIIIILIGAGVILYYMYSKKNESSKIEVKSEIPSVQALPVKSPSVQAPPVQAPPVQAPPVQQASTFNPKKMMNSSLLARLNSIPVN